MEAEFNPENGDFLISFDGDDYENDFLFLMEVVREEAWERGICVPDLKPDFFKRLVSAKGKRNIRFSYHYFDFIYFFLEESYLKLEGDGIHVDSLEGLLENLEDWRFGEWHTRSFTVQ